MSLQPKPMPINLDVYFDHPGCIHTTVSRNHFLSPCSIHLGGLITEGYMKGYVELTPAQYNVVLEDDTYKGMIEVGLKFIAKREERRETREHEVKQELTETRESEIQEELFQTRENELKEEVKGYRETKEFDGKEQRHSIYKAIASVLKSCWKRVFSERTNKRNKKQKRI